MSLYTVIKVWSAGEILTAADLNTEFANDILNGPINHASQHASGAVDDIKAYFLSLSAGGTVAAAVTFSAASSIALATKINENKGSDIIAASTTDIGAATGNFIDVTGNTTITALGTVQAGTRRIVRFTGAPTLTHNGTSLILPGAANIVAAANDIATFLSLGTGNWVCESYQRAVNPPYVPVLTPAATTIPLRRSTSPYAIDVAELAMTGETSASNGGSVNLNNGTDTEIVTLDLGSVTAGDRIYVAASTLFSGGNAAGANASSIAKSSGTATIQTFVANSTIVQNAYWTASIANVYLNQSGIIKVTGSGTLVLKLLFLTQGTGGIVGIGNGQIYAFFLKKQ